MEGHKEQDGASHEEEEQDDVDDVHCAKGRVWEWNVCSDGVPEGEYIYTSKMKRDRREKTLAMDRRATPNGTFAPKEGVRRMTTIAIKDQMAKAVFPQITMAPSASGEITVALMFDPRERPVMTIMTTTHIVPTAAKKLVKNRDPEM